jgi:hypothetical protein
MRGSADSARARGHSLGSLGKVHASHQVLEARIIAQAIEPGIDLQQYHPLAMLFEGNFQPVDGFVALTQSRVDSAHKIGCQMRIACIHRFAIGLQSYANPAKGRMLPAFQNHSRAEVLAVQPSHRESGQQ